MFKVITLCNQCLEIFRMAYRHKEVVSTYESMALVKCEHCRRTRYCANYTIKDLTNTK